MLLGFGVFFIVSPIPHIGRPKIFLTICDWAAVWEVSANIRVLGIRFIGVNPVEPINANHPQLEAVMVIWDKMMGVNTDLIMIVVQMNVEVTGISSIADI